MLISTTIHGTRPVSNIVRGCYYYRMFLNSPRKTRRPPPPPSPLFRPQLSFRSHAHATLDGTMRSFGVPNPSNVHFEYQSPSSSTGPQLLARRAEHYELAVVLHPMTNVTMCGVTRRGAQEKRPLFVKHPQKYHEHISNHVTLTRGVLVRVLSVKRTVFALCA